MGSGADVLKYRFQWNFPIVFSPHDPNTLYAAANVLFKSTDEGSSWQIISPDLTRNDKSKQGASGGPITKDNTSVEYYATIFALMESPVQAGTIWSGSDDGVIQLSRDGGKNWSNVTPPSSVMPEWIQINSIDASPHDAGTLYVAGTMYKWDDNRPYLYRTSDYGKTWKKITTGIPDGAFTRVIREDPNKRGLLYAGTETGMYVSFDNGERWQPLQLNLPVVPITDLAVHKRDKELVVATQGRSFWILDDLPVLYEMMDSGGFSAAGETRLFKPKESYRMPGGGGPPLGPTATVGRNPANGVVVYYSLKAKPTAEVELEFLDPAGKSIRKFTGRVRRADAPAAAPTPSPSEGGFGAPPPPSVPMEVGLNRFVWDTRHADAVRFPGMILWAGEVRGPKMAPGTYQVKLTVDGKSLTQNFELKADPRLSTTPADYAKQLELGLKIRDKLSETHNAIIQIREVRRQVEDLLKRVAGQPSFKVVNDAGTALNKNLTAVEEMLYQTKNQSNQDPLNYPIRLNNKLAALGGVVGSAEAAPTAQSFAVYDELTTQIDAELRKLDQIMRTEVPAFNQLVREQNIPAIVTKPATP
jgi:hypothetical protein